MPIVLDGGTVDVVLDIDKDKPAETRPAFVAKYPTALESVRYRQAFVESRKETDPLKQIAAVMDVLKIIVTGVKNMGTLTLDEALAKLSEEELFELVGSAREAVHLSEQDKKKSRSKLPSIGDSSAPVATVVSVTTPLPPSNPQP